ncbi:MAG: ABC transporter ATP-binding protein [bacterium]
MTDDRNGAIIETRGITKVYKGNGIEVRAVRGIDLVIERGDFAAIVGPSGSGKTTFLNIISGLDEPTDGEVFLKGRSLYEMSGGELSDFRRDHIGFIFQAYNLIPVLSAEENIEYVMLLQGVPKKEREERVRRILKQVDMEGYADRLPSHLSGGQQQRVAVARAMVSRPELILADEPTANLDSETGSRLLDMMKDLNERTGMTFVFSTHDPMIMKRAQRLIVLKDGEITKDEKRT